MNEMDELEGIIFPMEERDLQIELFRLNMSESDSVFQNAIAIINALEQRNPRVTAFNRIVVENNFNKKKSKEKSTIDDAVLFFKVMELTKEPFSEPELQECELLMKKYYNELYPTVVEKLYNHITIEGQERVRTHYLMGKYLVF